MLLKLRLLLAGRAPFNKRGGHRSVLRSVHQALDGSIARLALQGRDV
jgi:hypothetical protein